MLRAYPQSTTHGAIAGYGPFHHQDVSFVGPASGQDLIFKGGDFPEGETAETQPPEGLSTEDLGRGISRAAHGAVAEYKTRAHVFSMS